MKSLKLLIVSLFLFISPSSFGLTALCYYPATPFQFSHIVAWTGTDWFGWDRINHVTTVITGMCGYGLCESNHQNTVYMLNYNGGGQFGHYFYPGWPTGWWFDGTDIMYAVPNPPANVSDFCTNYT